ncbi:MAG: aldo/keto reductase [Oscillospiraceae bacterium]
MPVLGFSWCCLLGFGLMRLPLRSDSQKDIDMEQFKNMVDLFLERGSDYFDTSYVYHDGESENAVRKALVERHDRGSYRLASKFPAFMGFHTDEEIKKVFQEQLDRCGVEYFDYYLIHSLNRELYDSVKDTPLLTLRSGGGQKEKSDISGLSWHDDAEELDRVLNEHPEMEFVQIVVNYYDWDEPLVRSRECSEVIRKHGCEVIAMESVKGGMLAAVPKEAKLQMQLAHPDWSPAIWALQYAANLDGMITVLSGMSTLAQVEDNTRGMRDDNAFYRSGKQRNQSDKRHLCVTEKSNAQTGGRWMKAHRTECRFQR